MRITKLHKSNFRWIPNNPLKYYYFWLYWRFETDKPNEYIDKSTKEYWENNSH